MSPCKCWIKPEEALEGHKEEMESGFSKLFTEDTERRGREDRWLTEREDLEALFSTQPRVLKALRFRLLKRAVCKRAAIFTFSVDGSSIFSRYSILCPSQQPPATNPLYK